jgi:hypothetical protein
MVTMQNSKLGSLLWILGFAAIGCGGGGSSPNTPAGTPEGGTGGTGAVGGSGSNSPVGGSGTGAVGGTSANAKGVAVSPQVAHAVLGGQVQFTAIVSGIDDRTVGWKVQEGESGGTIDSSGRYTAPKSAGKYHVVATSTANGSLSGTAEVTVSAPQGTPPELTPGVWKDITPPIDGFKQTYGVTTVEVSPVDPLTIYIPVSTMGFWRTTDGGSNWEQLGDKSKPPSDDGNTVYYLDAPVRLEVDPADPNHLYATQGVLGEQQGFWVSNDAGASWKRTPGWIEAMKTTTRDVTHMEVDPTNFKHVILASHSPWVGMDRAGILETKDGGESWVAHPPQPTWAPGSLGISFLFDPIHNRGTPDTWLVTTDADGFWLTKDGAKNWKKVTTINAPHGGAQAYITAEGHVYSGGVEFPSRSLDFGETWEWLRDSGMPYNYYYTIWGDGKTLYTQPSFATQDERPGTWWSSPGNDGAKFTPYADGKQMFTNGPNMMRYDETNGILYAACWNAGFFALKVIK